MARLDIILKEIKLFWREVKSKMSLETCCWCLELKTGTLLIGYLGLVCDVALATAMIIGLMTSHTYMKEGKTEEVQTMGAIHFVILFFDLALVIINLFFAIVLLIGVHTDKRSYVRTYLIASTVFVVISIIIFPSSIATGATLRNVLADLVAILFNIYSLLVIRSYLKQEDEDRQSMEYGMA